MLVASAPAEAADTPDVSGYIEAELQGFPKDPLFKRQANQRLQPSIAGHLELNYDIDERNALHATLFGRYDQVDAQRSSIDAREAYWAYYGDDLEVRVGFLKEFWGRLEQENIVDIINQTDVVEDFKRDVKLGQLGSKLSLPFAYGRFDAYVLSFFRERPFPGNNGRYQFSLPVDEPGRFETSLKEWHPDVAARLQLFLDEVEVAVSHFYGTAREPRFLLRFDNAGVMPSGIKPRYDLIHQTGLEIQAVKFGTVWKGEGFFRQGYRDDFFAFGIGAEHELVRVFGTAASLTPFLEYYYDDRDRDTEPLTPFENDLFVGARLALNDFSDTVFQLQATVDTESRGTLLTLEGRTRIAENWTLLATLDTFINVKNDRALETFRRDDRGLIQIRRHF